MRKYNFEMQLTLYILTKRRGRNKCKESYYDAYNFKEDYTVLFI